MAGWVASASAAASSRVELRFVLECRAARDVWRRDLLLACSGEWFEDALPVSPFHFEKGLRSFAGWWYFATTGTQVGFESWLERDHPM